jgi:ubiquinone biosynthesis protein
MEGMALRYTGRIGRTYRHIDRYRQILGVLIRYGFGDLLESLKLDQYVEIGLKVLARRGHRSEIAELSRAERVRLALEALGPTFVKMGQILSTRPDLLPREFVDELQKLQDEVPPFPAAEARARIERELKRPLEQLFAEFDDRPLASASLGQVHRARLADGSEVVVKVQRPGIRKTIEVDLEIITHLAGLIERHVEGFETHRPTRVVEEFAKTIRKELDYRLEAGHINRFALQFTGDPSILVPEVYREASTARVLTMQQVHGIKPSQLERLEAAGLDRKIIAHRGADLLMKQVFVHGFFHADPHPGNIFVLPGNVICFLDFGMMGRLDRGSRERFADFMIALVERDAERCTDALIELTEWDDAPERGPLVRDLSDFIDRHTTRTLKELEIGPLLLNAMDTVSRHRLRVPPNLFLMLKALAAVEGFGRRLDPDFDITAEAAPFLRRIAWARLDPRRVAADLVGTGSEAMRLLRDIPGETRDILRMLRAGRLKLEFEHHRLGPLTGALERVSNRLAFAVVLASLVIGSALIIHAGLPPKWAGIPIIGLAGFLVAAMMGFWLLISILRHGKM